MLYFGGGPILFWALVKKRSNIGKGLVMGQLLPGRFHSGFLSLSFYPSVFSAFCGFLNLLNGTVMSMPSDGVLSRAAWLLSAWRRGLPGLPLFIPALNAACLDVKSKAGRYPTLDFFFSPSSD